VCSLERNQVVTKGEESCCGGVDLDDLSPGNCVGRPCLDRLRWLAANAGGDSLLRFEILPAGSVGNLPTEDLPEGALVDAPGS
jgi:hypothetical protein